MIHSHAPEDAGASRVGSDIDRLKRLLREDVPDPPVNEHFIETYVGAINSEARVSDYHRKVWDVAVAPHRERLKAAMRQVNDGIREVREQLTSVTAQLDTTARVIQQEDQSAGGVPWSTTDRLGTAVLVGVIVACVAIGMNTVATYLRESGMIQFVEHEGAAYVASSLPFLLTLVIAEMHNRFKSESARQLYCIGLGAAALVTGFMWLALFASEFGGASRARDIEDIVKGLSSPPDSGDVAPSFMIGAQLLGEILAAATAEIKLMTTLRQHKTRTASVSNPAYDSLAAGKRDLERLLHNLHDLEGKPEGCLTQLESRLPLFLDKALTRLTEVRGKYDERTRGNA